MQKQRLLLIVGATFVISFVASHSLAADTAAGIYQQKCATCHGDAGQGVADRHDGPLAGEASIDELAELITVTMPEDDPDSCIGDEARLLAEFIYHEFYSYDARLAKGLVKPPRLELMRLTVGQYRNAVADVLASFTPPLRDRDKGGDEVDRNQRGLRATYYQSEKMNKTDKQIVERIDPAIDFDFANRSPVEGMEPDPYTIVWQGSLQANQTGYHEFRIHSANGVRLYFNADPTSRSSKLRDDSYETIQARLIDGWVSSGEMRDLTGRIYLLAGRRYSLRVEFFKYEEPSGSIRLEWKQPHGVWSVVDEQVLFPTESPRTFVLDTPFPPDDRSVGYERGTSVSHEWHTAVANGAMAIADEVVGRLPLLSGVRTDSENRSERLGKFVVQLATAAYRRPLTDDEQQLLSSLVEQGESTEAAVRRAVLFIFTSPHFLYINLPNSQAEPDSHTVASRLALALWDSVPDAELQRLADLDRLTTVAQVEAQAARMLRDPRTRVKVQEFFRHWLEVEERDLSKDKELYPEFDEAVIADLRRSLELFVDTVVWGPTSDYRELLQADYLLLNRRLQQLYATAVDNPSDEFVRVCSDSDGRSGVLTHPYLLSAFSYHNTTSPIHRGVFLTRNIIGRQLKPPPVAVAFNNNDFPPDLTMREKITELTRDQACLGCHEVINPLGFALENFDAVGRLRSADNNKPIDTSAHYPSADGGQVPISSARDIAQFAVSSPSAHRAFVTQVFQHLVRQNPAAYGPETIDQLCENFVASQFHIRKLLVSTATRTALDMPATSIPSEPTQ